MPRHPGHRPPAPPGPGRLLPRAGAPMSIPTARPGPPDAARGSSLAGPPGTPSGRSHRA